MTDGALAKGNFVAPTIFVKTQPAMRIVREEIFGPVLAVQLFEAEDEAVRLANDTIYGLAGGVFTSDRGKGLRVLKKLRAGITWLNTYHPDIQRSAVGRLQADRHRARAGHLRSRRLHGGEADQRQTLRRNGFDWFSGLK